MRGVLLFAGGAVFALAIAILHPALLTGIRDQIQATLLTTQPRSAARYENAIVVTDMNEGGIRHFLGPHLNVRTKDIANDDWGAGVSLELTVNESGRVVAARAVDGSKKFFAEAEKIGLQLNFVPFRRQGKAIVARIPHFHIGVYPPERRPDYVVEFPEIKDWSSLSIAVRRAGTSGSYLYDLAIKGDGSVTFEGVSVAVPGKHRATISRKDLEALVDVLRRKKFFWLYDAYESSINHQAWWEMRVTFDGRTRRLVDYEGLAVGMPDAAKDIEYAIEAAVDIDRWFRGNAATAQSLLAEGWDFRAKSDANDLILAGVARGGPVEVMRDLLELGLAVRPDTRALAAAAERGHADMLGTLLGQQVKWSASALGDALVEGAGTGKEDIALALLQAGADPAYQQRRDWPRQTPLIAAAKAASVDVTTLLLRWFAKGRYETVTRITGGVLVKPWEMRDASPQAIAKFVNMQNSDGDTALLAAINGGGIQPGESEAQYYSRRRAIAKILLDAGANIEARGKLGRTPLVENAFDADMARLLLARGANVNARDSQGGTALMHCWTVELAQVLLEAGADPDAKDKEGRSAVEHAWEIRELEVAAFIRKWKAEHPAKAR